MGSAQESLALKCLLRIHHCICRCGELGSITTGEQIYCWVLFALIPTFNAFVGCEERLCNHCPHEVT